MDDIEDTFQPIAEQLLFSGALEEACELNKQRLSRDPEWATPKHYHLHTLVTAFAVGIINADPWHKNYKIPPNFENVINWISFCIQEKYKEVVVQVSLVEMGKNYREWADQNPYFLEWNESPKGTVIGITSRYSSTPEERDFIDLDALIQNAVLYLRDETRKNEEFDRKFEEEYKTNGEINE